MRCAGGVLKTGCMCQGLDWTSEAEFLIVHVAQDISLDKVFLCSSSVSLGLSLNLENCYCFCSVCFGFFPFGNENIRCDSVFPPKEEIIKVT